MTKLGFIGFGEAAFNIALGLKGRRLDSIMAYDKFWNVEPQSRLISERADKAAVKLAQCLQELIENSDIILSAVSADMAISLAQAAEPFLKKHQIYVDLNATSPMTKEAVDAIISPNALFVDCAVMGPVPNYKHKVPVSVSGSGAKVFFETMTPFGMNISLMDTPAGSASASKMFRSIFMKGFVMLILEMLVAAREYKVEDEVLVSVKDTLSGAPLLEVINGLLGRGVIHSERREHEMDEVIATLETINVDGIMSRAAKAKLRWCTNLGLKEYFKGIPPQDFHEIFTAINEVSENRV
jgi:3-hydroxyisobutyrate dehydrogenase-like beta-hydroxyacid dehydrogenase